MGRLDIIRAEIDTDPDTRGYAGMTDQQVADDFNTAYVAIAIENVTPAVFAGAIKAHVAGDWASLAQEARDYIMFVGSMDPVPVGETWVQNKLSGGANGIFQSGATQAALEALYNGTISKAQSLGVGKPKEGTIAQARALP